MLLSWELSTTPFPLLGRLCCPFFFFLLMFLSLLCLASRRRCAASAVICFLFRLCRRYSTDGLAKSQRTRWVGPPRACCCAVALGGRQASLGSRARRWRSVSAAPVAKRERAASGNSLRQRCYLRAVGFDAMGTALGQAPNGLSGRYILTVTSYFEL